MSWFWSPVVQHFRLASMLETRNLSAIPTVRLLLCIELRRARFSLSQLTTYVFRKFIAKMAPNGRTFVTEHISQIPTVCSCYKNSSSISM
jgi:hypothetical protein